MDIQPRIEATVRIKRAPTLHEDHPPGVNCEPVPGQPGWCRLIEDVKAYG